MASTVSTTVLLTAIVSAGWFLPVGFIRLLAYRSGSVDHEPGMRNLAIVALVLGFISLAAAIVLAAVMATNV